MLVTWLDKICHVLEYPRYPQIQGHLIKIETGANKESIIVGKCAMGEINCQLRGIEPIHATALDSTELLDFIPKIYVEKSLPVMCIHLDYDGECREIMNVSFEMAHANYNCGFHNIQSWIILLNDNGFKYTEIVEFLKTTFPEEITNE